MTTMTWVDAAPFRAHLQHLMAIGDLTTNEVATLAGVSWRAADSLVSGRQGRPVRRISPDTASALLSVAPQQAKSLRSCYVPAEESRARLHRLLRNQPSVSVLADELGVVRSVLDDLADGSLVWCPGLLALRLVVLARTRTVPVAAAAASTAAARADVAQEAA